jgi:hypothetical protein
MGLLRYILQGFGWQVGSEIAREAVDEVRQGVEAPAREPTARERARAERDRERREARERREREQAAARRKAAIERELAELKRRAGK